jgi:ribose/xylose/arabinose/galactoside ABC-type transport system permease subunit
MAVEAQVGAQAGGHGDSSPSHFESRVARIVARVGGLWLAIVLISVAFNLINTHFFDQGNLVDLLRSASSLAIVAFGETVVIIAAEIDLSIGSVYAFAPIVLGVLWINDGLSLYVAILAALGASALVGVVNGFFTLVVRIPSFVVTLGTLSLVNGIALLLGNAAYFTPAFSDKPLPHGELRVFNALGASSPFGIPAQVLWLLGIALAFVVVLHRSLFGFRIAAIGGNAEAASVARLPVRRYRLIAFVICSLMAAVAGIVDFSFLGSTQSGTSGSTLTFPVFAAVIIGGASLAGGSGTVIGTFTGAILLTVLSNGLALIGVGGGAQQVFVGVVTIGAVAIDRWAAHGGRLAGRIRSAVVRPRTSG